MRHQKFFGLIVGKNLGSYLLKASLGLIFTFKKVEEQWDSGLSQFRLWNQGHFQKRSDHACNYQIIKISYSYVRTQFSVTSEVEF